MNAPTKPPRLFRLVAHHQWHKVTVRAATHPEEIGYRHEGSSGFTALHVACIEGAAPPSVIHSLVEASPDGSAATEYRCGIGSTPLHVACFSSRPDYVDILLDANGRTATMTDDHGYDPIDMALYPFTKFGGEQLFSPSGISDEKISDRLASAWTVIAMLVEHRARQEGPGLRRGGNFLHACARISRCPPPVLQLMIDSDHFDVTARDADGNLPLHVAASNADLSGERAGGMVAILLGAHPGAAREVDAICGRLPLHVAVAAGKGWGEGVGSVVDAYPPALTVRDPLTGMFPFMMAASIAGPFGEDNDAVAEAACVNTVYKLLRACPELERFFHPGDEESVREGSGEGSDGVLEME